MEISAAETDYHEQKPNDVDSWIHKSSVISKEMHKHRRKQQKYNIAQLRHTKRKSQEKKTLLAISIESGSLGNNL